MEKIQPKKFISETSQMILEELKKHEYLTTADLYRSMMRSKLTVLKSLQDLRARGLVKTDQLSYTDYRHSLVK